LTQNLFRPSCTGISKAGNSYDSCRIRQTAVHPLREALALSVSTSKHLFFFEAPAAFAVCFESTQSS